MNETLAPATFLEQLRTTTAPSHTALEALPVSVSVMKPNVTNEEYALYLSLMQDVVKDAEENIFPVLSSAITDLDERTKAQFIADDLKHFEATSMGNHKPLSAELPDRSVAFALGIMYVVEGSSLGGRVILKNINTVLGHDADIGARYFAGYGGQTGSHWKNFLAMLTGYEAANNCGEIIIKGADYAFNAISRHFTENALR